MYFKLNTILAFLACFNTKANATVPWEEGDGDDVGEVTCTLQYIEALMVSMIEGDDGADE